jgi:tRNA G18 (ribose-2'-O)-methylase SpoU
MGNEINGVSKDLLDLSDVIFELPMQWIKQSLNVSVTAGIVMYYIWYFARQKNWEIT